MDVNSVHIVWVTARCLACHAALAVSSFALQFMVWQESQAMPVI